jgi:dTMP kinase
LARPLFIVFEGIDGSGTTTQSQMLASHVAQLGYPVVHTREPGGTPLAERIRRLVLDRGSEGVHPLAELLLYAASRAQHVGEVIAPSLQAGTPVICDRYVASTLAYQGYGRQLDLQVVLQVNAIAARGCLPDATVYLDLPVAAAMARQRTRGLPEDRLEAAGVAFQERVLAGYRQLVAQDPDTTVVLDGGIGRNDLAQTIRQELTQRWPRFPFSM